MLSPPVAEACGVSKPSLYHYVRDKHQLLAEIAEAHIARLLALVAAVDGAKLAPEPRLRRLIEAFLATYAGSQSEHRVLTEDVRFLKPAELAGLSRKAGLTPQGFRGLRPALDRPFWRSVVRRRVMPGFRFKYSRSLAVGYIGHVVKASL